LIVLTVSPTDQVTATHAHAALTANVLPPRRLDADGCVRDHGKRQSYGQLPVTVR
jgi:hypothetical protein